MIRQGAASLLLGEDLETGEHTAIRLEAIARIAYIDDMIALQDDDGGHDDDDGAAAADIGADHDQIGVDASVPRGPYLGPPVAGHLSCPCGSGKRYRDCCRGAAS